MRPPSWQWLAVAKKLKCGVLKGEGSAQTSHDTYRCIGVHWDFWVYSTGAVWIQRLGWNIYLERACGGGGCLIQTERGRKWTPNGTQTALDKATGASVYTVDPSHEHTSIHGFSCIVLCLGEDRGGREAAGGGASILQHQHRWKSFVSQQEDWPTFSYSRVATVPRTDHRMQTTTDWLQPFKWFSFMFLIFLRLGYW